MKKFFLVIAFGFSIVSFQSCGSDEKSATGTDNDEISAGSVPEPVKSAFSAKYANAADIKWEDASEDDIQTYKAKFTVDGKKMKAEFDAKGNFVKEEEDN
jgi:hypothetical protein